MMHCLGKPSRKVAYQFQTAHTGPHSRSAHHCASNDIAPADVLASVYCSGTRSEAADAAIDSILVQAVPVEALPSLGFHCEEGQTMHLLVALGKGRGGGGRPVWLGCKCPLAYSDFWLVTAAVVPCKAQSTTHVMHGLLMLQCVVPTGDAIVCHGQTHRVSLHFERVVCVQGLPKHSWLIMLNCCV